MNRTTRSILQAGAALLLLVSALLTEMIASRRPQANMLELATMFQDGFYGLEHTSTLPGPYGAASRTFRWTRPESSFMLWPPLGSSGILELEYLNPAATGYVQVRIGRHVPSGVPPADKLRILRLFLPPIDATMVQLTQAAPIASGDRQLGLLVSAARWWAVGPDISAGSFPLRWELLRGLPLTLALLAGLGLLLRLPYRWSFGL
ncbi:MAG: hypothetical protein M3380_06985, partial [Chloroflexota bacterium]|nr:hypothetical protein [Chloroflexota bacterium]